MTATTITSGREARAWTTRLCAALAGLLAAALALGVGDLFAGLFRDAQLPRDAVGAEFIDRTPIWLKNFAVEQFGTNDKVALRVGMLVVIGLLALVLGAVAWRRRWIGIVGFGAFGFIGGVIAVRRPTGHAIDAFAPMVGAVAGIIALLVLLDRLEVHPAAAGGTTSAATDSWSDRLRQNLGTTERKAAIDRRGFFLVSWRRRGRCRRGGRRGEVVQAAVRRLGEPRQRRAPRARVCRRHGAVGCAVAGRRRVEVRHTERRLLPDRHRTVRAAGRRRVVAPEGARAGRPRARARLRGSAPSHARSSAT